MTQLTRAAAAISAPKRKTRVPDSIKLVALGLVVAFLFVADGWITFHSIVEMKGKSFDFYFIWRGSREMASGRDPYTPEIARQIQVSVSDDSVGMTEAPYYFVYPPLLTPLVFPFVAFPFAESVTVWLVSLQVFLVVALVLTLRAVGWKPRPITIAGLITAWIAFRYSMVAMLLGQTTPLILLLISGAILASRLEHERISAILLAAAMIKPQLVLFVLIGWLIATLQRRQWHAIGIFTAATFVTLLFPFMFFPEWLSSFMNASSLYLMYRPSVSALSMITAVEPRTSTVSFVIGAGLLVGYMLRVALKTRDMVPIASLSILLSLVVFPLASVYDISLALLPWLACLYVLVPRAGVAPRLLLIVLCALPGVSWLIITVLPNIVESMGLTFDAVGADKIIIPLTLLFVFVCTERKQMWQIT